MTISMLPIASCRDVDIFATTEGKFAFLKSPFAAHTTMSAVDIYPGGSFGDVAPSPVSGSVIDIREFQTPTPYFSQDFMEYLIAISHGDSVVRILHVRPTVRVGETINVGDPLGILIRNGYFYYWNDAGMHVEVRQDGDYLRARNDNPLTATFDFCNNKGTMISELLCRVVYSDERYALLEGDCEGGQVKGYGLGGCLLEGMIPIHRLDAIDYFGLIGKHVPITSIRSAGNRHMVASDTIQAKIMNERNADCLALGFSLSCSGPVIKTIPFKYGHKLFDAGECVTVQLSLVDPEVN